MRLVEVFRRVFSSPAEAALVATTARAMGLDVEQRPAGELGVLVVVSGLHADRAAGERLVLLAMGDATARTSARTIGTDRARIVRRASLARAGRSPIGRRGAP